MQKIVLIAGADSEIRLATAWAFAVSGDLDASLDPYHKLQLASVAGGKSAELRRSR